MSLTSREPIAIVGIGCRFAGGVDSPQALWDLLCTGSDAITPVPSDRWDPKLHYSPDPKAPGKSSVCEAGYLTQRFEEFDAGFFGIIPKEAECLDPQQRILLEVAFEALEDAGIDTKKLAGTSTGVYIGGFTMENGFLHSNMGGLEQFSPNLATSVTLCMLSNRLSYTFDLHGPSLTIDTACSSSLVALHYACNDIWAGKIPAALAGGVNMMVSPEYPIILGKGGFLAADGRCKSFDSRADGYGRGEGAGILVLEPLSQALANNDQIYALVRATGVNQDGRTNGITVPSANAQEALVRKVYEDAKLDPAKTVYVEAHGTGTPVGDPLECQAIGRVLGNKKASGQPLLIGSIKSSIGHTEAAAGVAGIIKAALCLKKKAVPPQANLVEPNPSIPFELLGLKLPRKLEPLVSEDTCMQASINSFGYGGTNAHIVLSTLESNTPLATCQSPSEWNNLSYLVPFSAGDPQALTVFASQCAQQLKQSDVSLGSFYQTMTTRRTHHDVRLGVISSNREELVSGLEAFANNTQVPGITTGQIAHNIGSGPVFVFTGMGTQWWGMGRELLAKEPVFRETAELVDQAFIKHSGWSILKELLVDEKESRATQNQYAQPGNFLIQASLAALWAHWGIRPSAVIGHSVGEVSAAYVAGALSLDDAACVSFYRSQAQQRMAGFGKMLALSISQESAEQLIEPYKNQVDLAAVNSPTSCTLAGEEAALQELSAQLTGQNIFNRILTVEVAYHSSQMDPLQDEVLSTLASIRPTVPQIPIYSTVTGKLVEPVATHDARYWWKNVRNPVLFEQAARAMLRDDYSIFVEVGPHPALATSIKECMSVEGKGRTTLMSLHRKQKEKTTLLETLAKLYTLGFDIAWEDVGPTGAKQPTTFTRAPAYPWQRQRIWHECEASRTWRMGGDRHLLLGFKQPGPDLAFQSQLLNTALPWIPDHKVDQSILLPAAAFVETAIAAQRTQTQKDYAVIENLEFKRALVIAPHDVPRFRVEIKPKTRELSIYSQAVISQGDWVLNSSGRLSDARPALGFETLNIVETTSRCQQSLDVEQFYQTMTERNLHYGPAFQGVQQLYRGNGEVLAQIVAPASIENSVDQYALHPAMLDACFQALFVTIGEEGGTYLPVGIHRIVWLKQADKSMWVHGQLKKHTPQAILGDLTLADNEGNIIAMIEGLRCQAVGINHEKARTQGWYLTMQWEPIPIQIKLPANFPSTKWLFLNHENVTANDLCENFRSVGAACVTDAHTGPVDGIVWFPPKDCASDSSGEKGVKNLLHLFKSQSELGSRTRIIIVTRGAQSVLLGESADPAQAALWGLARVAMTEHPEFRPLLIDLEANKGFPPGFGRDLLEIADDELACRGAEVFAHRVIKAEHGNETKARSQSVDTPFVVKEALRGSPDAVQFQEIERIPPKAGEVELRVLSVPFTFRDVVQVLGIYGNESDSQADIGLENCGEVVAVGADVTRVKQGDIVLALPASGALRSYVTVAENRVLSLPKSDYPAQTLAAQGSSSFATALYILEDVARIRAGERVLMNLFAGGVALAVLQIAKRIGAEVYATAETQEQKEALLAQGAKAVWDAHTTDLTQQIMNATNGFGIDIAINLQAGEIVEKTLSVMAPLGRFIEMGKRDILDKQGLPLEFFDRGLTYAAIDPVRLWADSPERFQVLMERFFNGLESERYKPIPINNFPVSKIGDACRMLSQARNIGLVTLDFSDGELSMNPPEDSQPIFSKDGNYLITGGFGGFGLALAEWMSAQGAGALTMISRSGATSEEAREKISAIEKRGTKILTAACDVADSETLEKLLARCRKSMPPLRGVFHAAAVIHDEALVAIDPAYLTQTFRPKVLGALNLDNLTSEDPLDMFVLFSSGTVLIGNRGQGSYVSANAALDALAWQRRARGKPALSVQWGAISDVGVAARELGTIQHLKNNVGVGAFHSKDALESLGILLKDKTNTEIGVVDIDWRRFGNTHPQHARSLRFANVIPSSDAGDNESPAIRALREAPSNERLGRMLSTVKNDVAKITGVASDKIDIDKPLNLMGLDSLMAAELQTALQLSFNIEFPYLELISGISTAKLTANLLERAGLLE